MTRTEIPNAPAKKISVRERQKWIADVTAVANDITRWSEENDWTVKWETKSIHEDEIGSYEVPALIVQTAQGRLYVTPIARFFYGKATGRIELTGPSFEQVILLRIGQTWRFYSSEEMVSLKKTWSKGSFLQIARNLLSRP